MTKRKDNKGRILRDGEIQKADGRYEFRYQDVNGVRRSLYSWKLTDSDPLPNGKRACRSLRDLEKVVLKDVLDGIDSMNRATLNSRWEIYISNKSNLRESTRASYKYLYSKYIQDELGGMPVSSIKYSTVKSFFNKLIFERGLKSNTIRAIYIVLNPVLTVSVRDGVIRKNPAEGVLKELNLDTPKKHGLTEKQQTAFLKYLDETDIFRHWKPLFVCLLGTGCRPSEILGLKWDDILWEENLISITHALSYKNERKDTLTKTKSGVRVIPMFQSVRSALLEEKIRHPGSEYVFVNRSGKPRVPYDINKAVDRILEHYELEGRKPEIPNFTAHQLRHTFCMRLCERETDLKLIQEIMGHAKISTTMDIYNESNVDRKKASFERIESTTDFTTNSREVI